MTRSRRFALLVAAALLLLSLAGWAVSAASAASLAQERVGTPRHGDRWTYETTEGVVELRWNGTRAMHDEWGRAFDADVLEARTADELRVFLYPGGSSAPEAMVTASGEIAVGSGGTASSPLPQASATMIGTIGSLWYHSGHHPASWACAAVAPWQGVALGELDRASVLGDCAKRSGELELRARGLDEIGGLLAQRFDFRAGGMTQGSVWLAPDVPYALAFASCEFRCPDAADAQYRLVAYEPGTGAPLATFDPRGPAPDRVGVFAPLPASGVHADTTSEFTATEALAAIAADASLTTHRAWMDAHPDALLSFAHHDFDVHDDAEDPRERWAFVWRSNDGTTSLATSEEDGDCTLHALAPMTLPREAGQCRPRNSDEGDGGSCTPACGLLDGIGNVLTFDSAIAMFEERRYDDAFPFWTHSMALMEQRGEAHARIAVSSAASPGGPRGLDPLGQNGGPATVSGEMMVFDAFTGKLLHHSFVTEATTVWTTEPGWLARAIDPAAAPSVAVESRGAAPAWKPPAGVSAASAALGLAILLALAATRALAAVAVLYSRLVARDVAEHPRRVALLHAIRAQPGASIAELADLTAIRGGGLRYHLATLERARLVVRIEAGSDARHYLAGSASPLTLAFDAVVRSEGAEARMLTLLQCEPGLHASEAARRLGVSRAAATRVARSLVARGLVRAKRDGRARRLFALPPPSILSTTPTSSDTRINSISLR